MRLLLDTHAFLWAISARKKLTAAARNAIEDKGNVVFVSAISFWEIAIKLRLGKLALSWKGDIIDEAHKAGFVLIPLTSEEAATSGSLKENSHFDPFDRMLIWQALQHQLTIISRDKDFKRFEIDGLKILWK